MGSERYISNLEKHIENTKSNMKYSLDRFDVLIITLSSGGLVFSMSFIKDIEFLKDVQYLILLNISWIFFGTSIISNLLSQVTGYLTNKIEIIVSNGLIRKKRKKQINIDIEKLETKGNIANVLTHFFNGLSLILLIGAIVLLIVFISFNLK